MPRTPSFIDPRRDALDQARLDQGDRRLSLEDERNLLARAQMIERLAVTRFKVETARREAVSSAKAISALGAVDPTSATYARDRANVMASFPEALGNQTVRAVLEKTDQSFLSHQSAQQNLELERNKDQARKDLESQKEKQPINVARAALDYSSALQHLDTIAQQFTQKKQPIPSELQNWKTYLTKQGEAMFAPGAAPAAAAPTAPPVVAPAAASVSPTTVPPVATPTSAATPTAVATSDAVSFLQKALGQTPPSPAATPQVQATPAGLPDAASAALNPDDETTD